MKMKMRTRFINFGMRTLIYNNHFELVMGSEYKSIE